MTGTGSSNATDAGNVVAEFEAAMAARDGQRAVSLVESLPPEGKAQRFARAFNLLAYGVDRDKPLGLDEVKALNEECAERAVAYIVDKHCGSQNCDDPRSILYDIDIAGGPIHKRDAPWICYQLVAQRTLTPQAARDLTRWAWVHCEYPEANFDPDGWRLVFTALRRDGRGPLTDVADDEWAEMAPADRATIVPTAPIRLYRGAIASRADGMAWTGSLDVARWFADRFNNALDDTARVYTTVVEPHRIYARFVGRGEDEYVIDTTGLDIDEWEDGDE